MREVVIKEKDLEYARKFVAVKAGDGPSMSHVCVVLNGSANPIRLNIDEVKAREFADKLTNIIAYAVAAKRRTN